jgi:hypothetical protein
MDSACPCPDTPISPIRDRLDQETFLHKFRISIKGDEQCILELVFLKEFEERLNVIPPYLFLILISIGRITLSWVWIMSIFLSVVSEKELRIKAVYKELLQDRGRSACGFSASVNAVLQG